ncbi:unnamed protein product [Gongylonema pulchrum]|uniref:C2H2-type domain-containing protein n=1 Tax=Gongylonema pulchrum TaxID=637853 RepID=A0A183DVQ1_9BILA|nr:unnamed protein product [Gongylonema pulchrum]
MKKSKGSDQKAAAQKALTHNLRALSKMTRGHMKMQAKAKNMKKQEALKKSVGHDQKGACLKSLIYKCTVCMAQMMDKRSYREHFESKHPKSPLPAELAESEQPAGS